jgi:hypothetical protein
MRGCALPFFVILVFFVGSVPIEAQYWAIGIVRDALLSETGRNFATGAAGASFAAAFWYSWGWNSLARQLHRDDYAKADKALSERRK